ncbi:hypothetical protein O6H91_19G022500 [Diphasiastrum complanatum]|uniref:Uncharacterized protein n=2 Tax=Diphasiastrum complanatum TaxID=34168 RepID=A0ACC2ATB7_DIPCM|nr:hypothetical protein O6H91_19G022500 [Diphasiastrum complanatum]
MVLKVLLSLLDTWYSLWTTDVVTKHCSTEINNMKVEKGLQQNSFKAILTLAYQSFGVVYGDLSTSPLYVYRSTFSQKWQLHEDDTEILGVLSFIFYTLTLIPVMKYIFIVLSADDNGEGGTFALYSLLCRHAKLSMLPNQQTIDKELSTYKLDQDVMDNKCSKFKIFLEKHKNGRTALLIVVLLGTSMVIGDGILTPAISVLSAVSGIEVAAPNLHDHVIDLIACIVLVGLFALQHFGTRKVAFMFAPIVLAWLFCISSIGIYNIFRWNPHVFCALSPYYMYNYLSKMGTAGWASLGGILLSITGTEAMFADLGHFSRSSIKVAFTCVVYPSLVLAYMGQAAYLSKHHGDIQMSFYKSIPRAVFWPVFVVATLASVVGSQAVISATFSVIRQCSALGCFPRVKVVHTSKNIYGQVYIPEINWILLILCLAITIGFRDTILIGHAYGIAVITVMFVTTCLMSLVIVVVWQRSILFALCFLVFFGSIELLYISAALVKVPEGGWVPLVLSFIFMAIMYVWHYGTKKKYEFDVQNKVSMKWLLALGPSLGIVRVPGIGLIYTELVTGVPPIFSHFVTNLPAFHEVLVFVCIKSVPVPYVPPQERFLIGRIGPKEYRMYRCILRYGYKDVRKDDDDFENQLILSIGEFIQSGAAQSKIPSTNEGSDDAKMAVVGTTAGSGMNLIVSDLEDMEQFSYGTPGCKSFSVPSLQDLLEIESPHLGRKKRVKFELPKSPDVDPDIRDELRELIDAREAGIAYIIGHSYVQAKKSSSLLKKFAVDVVYSFLRRNCRGSAVALSIPHICLIEVGMIYYV